VRKIEAWFAGLIVFVGCCGVEPGTVSAAPLFADLSDRHWARTQIGQAVQKGYASGYPDGTFGTKQAATKAEFVKWVVDALKLPHSQGGSPWYQEYAAAAYEFGLLEDGDTEAFEKPIRRAEMMKILGKALLLEERYREAYDSFRGLEKADFPFEDRNLFQKTDLPYIALAYGTGITAGYPDGRLGINRSATRAEAVVMIEKWLEARLIDPTAEERWQEMRGKAAARSSAAERKENTLSDQQGESDR